jgi:hypothetical protein
VITFFGAIIHLEDVMKKIAGQDFKMILPNPRKGLGPNCVIDQQQLV